MSRTSLTVFLCTGKDCTKAWRRWCDGSPGKWLKRRVEEAGLPYKLRIVKTECMDHCDRAACLCCVHGGQAGPETGVRAGLDRDRLLARVPAPPENLCSPRGGFRV